MTQCTPKDPSIESEKIIESTCAEAFKSASIKSGFKAIICTQNNEMYRNMNEKHPGKVLLCEGQLGKCRKNAWRGTNDKEPDR